MDTVITETHARMGKVLDLLKADLGAIRTGRAAPSLVENLIISAYGGSAKLKVMELATVHAQDQSTLVITPFDQSTIHEIEKGIQEANTGLNPIVDAPILRITIQPLSQERRQELIHLMKQKLENGRIMIRQVRQESMNELKKQEDLSEDELARLEKEVQKATDDTINQVDAMGKHKEDELLQI